VRRAPAAALALLAALPAARGAGPDGVLLAVRADRLHRADGTTTPDAVILLRGGRVVGEGGGLPIPEGTRVARAAVATAGFADLWTRVPGGNGDESPRPFAPALRAADALDPREPAAAAAARAGVLARLLLPAEGNPAPGRAAAVRVADPDGSLAIENADAGGVLSICAAAATRERYPASLAGVLRGLESLFDRAAGARPEWGGPDAAIEAGEADLAALRTLASGASPAYLFARTRAEVAAALRLAAARGLRPVLVDPRCGAGEILDAARAAGVAPADLGAILVLDLDDPLFRLRAPGELARAGVRVGFGSGGPGRGPEAVRRAAALAVRHGMEPRAAREALLGTGFAGLRSDPAGIAGGSLVLLDGEPADPAARILGVLVGGAEVPGGAPGKSIFE
jgi:hypothetical protein